MIVWTRPDVLVLLENVLPDIFQCPRLLINSLSRVYLSKIWFPVKLRSGKCHVTVSWCLFFSYRIWVCVNSDIQSDKGNNFQLV